MYVKQLSEDESKSLEARRKKIWEYQEKGV